MNSKIDYSTIPDLVDKKILSQKISFNCNSKIVETKYINDDNKEVKLTQTLMKKSVLDRKKWAKFGAAKVSNDGVTSFGAEVNIEYVKKDTDNFIRYPVPIKKVSNLEPNKSFKKNNEQFTPYRLNNRSKKNNEQFTPYKPNNRFDRSNGSNRNKEFVVVIKNIPRCCNRDDLRHEGNKYGYVTRAKILDRKGIGFLHYNTQEEQELSIQNLHRTNILGGHMLIHAEKCI